MSTIGVHPVTRHEIHGIGSWVSEGSSQVKEVKETLLAGDGRLVSKMQA